MNVLELLGLSIVGATLAAAGLMRWRGVEPVTVAVQHAFLVPQTPFDVLANALTRTRDWIGARRDAVRRAAIGDGHGALRIPGAVAAVAVWIVVVAVLSNLDGDTLVQLGHSSGLAHHLMLLLVAANFMVGLLACDLLGFHHVLPLNFSHVAARGLAAAFVLLAATGLLVVQYRLGSERAAQLATTQRVELQGNESATGGSRSATANELNQERLATVNREAHTNAFLDPAIALVASLTEMLTSFALFVFVPALAWLVASVVNVALMPFAFLVLLAQTLIARLCAYFLTAARMVAGHGAPTAATEEQVGNRGQVNEIATVPVAVSTDELPAASRTQRRFLRRRAHQPDVQVDVPEGLAEPMTISDPRIRDSAPAAPSEESTRSGPSFDRWDPAL